MKVKRIFDGTGSFYDLYIEIIKLELEKLILNNDNKVDIVASLKEGDKC